MYNSSDRNYSQNCERVFSLQKYVSYVSLAWPLLHVEKWVSLCKFCAVVTRSVIYVFCAISVVYALGLFNEFDDCKLMFSINQPVYWPEVD